MAHLLAFLLAATGQNPNQCIAVIGTSDAHGAIQAHKGSFGMRYGGLLTQGSYIDAIRKVYGERVILVDGGDVYQGTLASNLSEGESVIAAMNAMKFSAAAIGNHEFDFGPGKNGAANDRRAVLHQRLEQSEYPWLGINIYDEKSGRRVRWPNTKGSVLINAGGIKVGVIGAATPDTKRVTRLENVVDLRFRHLEALVIAEARSLRTRGAQLVVFVAHMGGKCLSTNDPNDLSSCVDDSEMMQLIKNLPPGTIDVASGGHTHSYMAHWLKGTATVQAGAHAKHISLVEACLNPTGLGIDPKRSTLNPPIALCSEHWADRPGCSKRPDKAARVPANFMQQSVQPSDQIKTIVSPYLQSVSKTKAKPVGVTLPKGLTRDAESAELNLGNYVAWGMRESVGADFSVQNRGGVRADMDAGPQNFGDIFQVLPFDNVVAKVKMRGDDLRVFVQTLVERRAGVLPYIDGGHIRQRGRNLKITIGTQLLKDDKIYLVATNDFLAKGGEGLGTIFKRAESLEITGIDLREALTMALRKSFPSSDTTDVK